MITPDFSAYAVKAEVLFGEPLGGKELGARVEDLLSKIAQACGDAGAVLIGHIKCAVEAGDKGFLAASVLEPRGRPMSRGELKDGISRADLVINVLLYGLTREQVKGIVDPLVRKELSSAGARVTLKDLEEKQGSLVRFQDL